jgi:hypothetical protein
MAGPWRALMAGGLAVALGSLVMADAGGGPRAAPPLPPLGLRLAVAVVGDAPVANRPWLDEQVARAQRIFAPAGVRFRLVKAEPISDVPAEVHTRADRHGLRDLVAPEVINAFVVARLRDVDEPSRFRQGVHWRPPPRPGPHYVILSVEAGPDVLAHELGHFFGNHGHSDTPGNIMSYTRGDVPPFFDDTQIRRIRRHVRRFLHTGELTPVQ